MESTLPAETPPKEVSKDPSEVKPVPRYIIKAREKLGLSEKRWNAAALAAYQQFGKWIDVPICCRILLVRDFDSLDQVQNAMVYCANILADKNSTTQQRLDALEMQTLIAQAQVKLSGQIMELAEKAGDKTNGDKPKNKPPQIPMQFNFNTPNPPQITVQPANNAATDVDSEKTEG